MKALIAKLQEKIASPFCFHALLCAVIEAVILIVMIGISIFTNGGLSIVSAVFGWLLLPLAIYGISQAYKSKWTEKERHQILAVILLVFHVIVVTVVLRIYFVGLSITMY